MSVPIVDDTYCRREAELYGATPDYEGIMRIVDASADHGINVDVKFGMLGQQLQLLVEHLQ